MQPCWHFEQEPRTGGADAEAYRNTLAGVGVPKADLFAREAVQNSVDAHDRTERPVRVRFERRDLTGEALARFRRSLHLAEGVDGPLSRPGLLSTGAGERSVGDALTDPFPVLLVEDFNTFGLTGVEDQATLKQEDRFRRLCLKLGSSPEVRSGRGGTFGYGKAVYWVSSQLWTVLFYSRFAPSARSADAYARLFGVSWFRAHTHPRNRPNDPAAQFTGRAFFGQHRGEGFGPLVDADAQSLAEEIGFTTRAGGRNGLSVMILGCDLDLSALLAGIEAWWWPRLVERRLEAELVEPNGARLAPNPRENVNLGRYVRAWELLRGTSARTDDEEIKELTYRRQPIGRYAITIGQDPDAPVHPDPDDRVVRNALVRCPGMVVAYERGPQLSTGHPTCAGVFLADESIDGMLARSEPPAHDRWDPDTTRGDYGLDDAERNKIRHILQDIRAASRDFIKEHREQPPTPPDRCEELERFLGRYLAAKKGKPPPPPSTTDPFRVNFPSPIRRNVENGVALESTVTLSMAPEHEGEELQVQVTAWAETVLDHGSTGDRLPMRLMDISSRNPPIAAPTSDAGATRATILLTQGEEVVIALQSATLPHDDYLARLKLDIRVPVE